jgi:DNA-binding transcriptional regulator YbjK
MRFPKKFAVIALAIALLPAGANAVAVERETLLDFDTRDVMEQLQEAVSLHDEIKTLEPSKLFGRDQKSARSDMAEVLDEAMALFESSRINELRQQFRTLENKIQEQQALLSNLRSERVLAPVEEESLKSKIMLGDTLKRLVASTKGDYDRLITSAEADIAGYEASKDETVEDLRLSLDAIGLSLSGPQIESLLSSVVGDDIVEMTVVFNSIKDITGQLAEMAAASNEDLEHSKKYYGMVVVLHRMVSLMQQDFISDVKEEYLPGLDSFRTNADAYIKNSKNLMKGSDNREQLSANIAANELTRKVIDLYSSMLTQQVRQVEKALQLTQRQQAVAENTYDTVALSASVVSMIREGGRTFDQLVSLQAPDVRVFRNEQMLTEFRRLTAELKNGGGK